MSRDRIFDCTSCVNLRTYPNPTELMHAWRCAANGLCVGPTIANCSNYKRRKGGQCPPPADRSRLMWMIAVDRVVAQIYQSGRAWGRAWRFET